VQVTEHKHCLFLVVFGQVCRQVISEKTVKHFLEHELNKSVFMKDHLPQHVSNQIHLVNCIRLVIHFIRDQALEETCFSLFSHLLYLFVQPITTNFFLNFLAELISNFLGSLLPSFDPHTVKVACFLTN